MELKFMNEFMTRIQYYSGHGRTYDIYVKFRSLKDLHWPHSEVLVKPLRSGTTTDLPTSRCAAGLLNGNIGVIKSMMAELTDSTNRAQVSVLMPLAWALGVTIGYVAPGIQRVRFSLRSTIVHVLVDFSRARTKGSLPCSEIGSGKNTRTCSLAFSPPCSVRYVSSSRGYSWKRSGT